MQTFVSVAEAGSFSAVADRSQVARSAVTRQVAALEKHLGVKLINRSTRRLSLTAEGAAYLERCRVILNMVDAAESVVAIGSAELRGRIRIGLPLHFGLQQLLPHLLDFAGEHPAVEFVMDIADRRSNLVEEGLDLSIRITSRLEEADVVRKLGSCALWTLASPQYLARHGEPRHPEELRHHSCLVYSNDPEGASWEYEHRGTPTRVPVRGRIVADDGVALCEAAARGMGVTRQPDFIAAPYVQADRLRPILRRFSVAPLGIYAVLPGNRYVPQRVRALIDALSDALRRRPRPR
jgi:DNA-binding transcriptional LysR family regulator